MAKSRPSVAEVMNAVKAVTGVPCIWKDAFLARGELVPRSCTNHESRFCRAHKRRRRLFRKCVRDDVLRLGQRCRQARAPFLKTCHAGVVELVVPVFDGSRHLGAFCLGPFQADGTVARRRFGRALASELPRLDGRTRKTAETLLLALGGYAVLAAQSLAACTRTVGVRDSRVQKALEYVDEHLSDKLTSAVLGTVCCLSPSRFLHLFKEEVGVSFARHVRQVRIEHAKRLLANTSLKVADIAAEVGFWDQNHLASAFRKHAGQTPTQYRAAVAQDPEP
jgi:AraC-like DNA-binding protein